METKWVKANSLGTLKDLWDSSIDQFHLSEGLPINNTYTIPSGKGTMHAINASFELLLQKITDQTVWFLTEDKTDEANVAVIKEKMDAFAILMTPKSAKEMKVIEVKTSKDRLYNDIIIITHELNMTVPPGDMNNYNILVKCLANSLWYIDSHTEKIKVAGKNGNCPKLPTLFDKVYDYTYNDYKSKNAQTLHR